MNGVLHDLHYALRTIRRSPGAAAVSILTLAVGIGGATAVFCVIDPLVFRQLPVPNPGELISVEAVRPDVRLFDPLTPERARVPPSISPLEFAHFRARTRSTFDSFLEGGQTDYDLVRPAAAGTAPALKLATVSPGYFSTLRIVPALGRGFIADDERRGGAVGVISDTAWRRWFGADTRMVGREIDLARRGQQLTITVVGVAPPGFTGTAVGVSTDVWTAMPPQRAPAVSPREPGWWFGGRMMARLRPDVGLDAARRELESAYADLLRQQAGEFELSPDQRNAFTGQRLIVRSGARGWGDLRTQYAQPLFIVIAAVGAVLAIACVNVAMLLLAQGAGRAREIAVRLAVGSGRWNLVRQQLTTNAVLAMAGGGLGFLLAAWSVDGIVRYAPALADSALSFAPGLRAAGFTVAVAALSTMVFGVLPAIRLTGLDAGDTLRGTSAGATSSRWSSNRALVAAQVAVSLILLVVAGLLMRTLSNLRGIETGLDDAVLRVTTTGLVDVEPILARLERVAGVTSATAWQGGLFGEGVSVSGPVVVDGFTPRSEQERFVPSARVGPRFFETMGIAILYGRAFLPEDGLPNRNVVIVSDAMAVHFFGRSDAVGRRFRLSPGPQAKVFEVVGVAANTKYNSLREGAARTIYSPLGPPRATVGLAVRVSSSSAPIASAIAGAIRQADSALTVTSIRSLEEILEVELQRERMLARSAALLSVLGLFLACLGLYGMTAHAVASRTAEIGVRMALGARAGTVISMLMRETGGIVLTGAVLGVAGTLVATRALSGLLFGLTETDPQTVAAAVFLLGLSTALAAYLAARRAARIDPIIALRYE